MEATIPILDKEQTNSLRSLSKEIAESMYVKTKADFISLAQTISEMGFKNNVLSFVFSYLLDGKMWTKLVLFEDVDNLYKLEWLLLGIIRIKKWLCMRYEWFRRTEFDFDLHQ